jgi:hypothetical protein
MPGPNCPSLRHNTTFEGRQLGPELTAVSRVADGGCAVRRNVAALENRVVSGSQSLARLELVDAALDQDVVLVERDIKGDRQVSP